MSASASASVSAASTGGSGRASAFAQTTSISLPTHFNKLAFERGGMQYVRLGNTGAVVSRIALGLMSYARDLNPGEARWEAWVMGQAEGEKLVQQALEAGINLFDTAEMYSDGRSEEFFGAALKKLLSKSRFAREDLVISTKIIPGRTLNTESSFGGLQKGLSRKAILAAVEGSLQRLGVEYIDLYFIHRYDPDTAVEETMRVLHDLVTAGKIRYIGASSMYAWQFAKLQRAAEQNGWTKFTVMQNHYNALYREEEREMIPFCLDTGVTLMPYSPLAAGVLVRPPGVEGESKRAETDQVQRTRYFKSGDERIAEVVQIIAAEKKVSAAQVALAWLLAKSGVAAPIIGATKPHHISDAVASLQVKLTKEEMRRIEEYYQPHAIAGHA